ncbi:MAG: TlpA disulfide reductase family protein, partial [Actinomycetota bacterium]|nr:TlpA disulfide reductase family protein [Actinomycetota bacterium]
YVADRLRSDNPVVAASSDTEGTTPEAESGSTSTSTIPEPPARVDIEVGGQPLPPLSGGDDPAIGMPAPTLQGFDLAGRPVAILDDGRPKAVYFLAHWCPHCQVELPKIVELVESGALPSGLDIYLVSTAVDGTLGNYPPAAWFEAEGWTEPVLDDSASAAALHAFGGTGFPFAVYVEVDNTVLLRVSGETPPERILEFWTMTALTG